MRASIVIATYNEQERLLKTIASCLETAGTLDCEIIVSDDRSDDGSIEEVRRRFPAVEVLTHAERRGTSPTKDDGARRARGEVLVFLDAHCKPEGDAIERLVADVEATQGRAIVTPRIAVLDAERWENDARHAGHGYRVDLETFTTGWVEPGRMRPDGESGLLESPGLIACCAAMSRSLYETLRGFDPGLGSWGLEDLDLGLKCWLMGYPVLHDPGPVIGHRFQSSFTNYDVPAAKVAANELRIARKHFDDATWEEWRRLAGARRPDWPWEEATAIFEAGRDSLERERAYLREHRAHDAYWYAGRFGLSWPAAHPWRFAARSEVPMMPREPEPAPVVSPDTLADDPREFFLEHYRHPRHRTMLVDADAAGTVESAGGAILTVYLRLGKGATIERAAFQSERCGVAVAYASLLVEMIQGRGVDQARAITPVELMARFGERAGAVESASLAVVALRRALERVPTKGMGSS